MSLHTLSIPKFFKSWFQSLTLNFTMESTTSVMFFFLGFAFLYLEGSSFSGTFDVTTAGRREVARFADGMTLLSCDDAVGHWTSYSSGLQSNICNPWNRFEIWVSEEGRFSVARIDLVGVSHGVSLFTCVGGVFPGNDARNKLSGFSSKHSAFSSINGIFEFWSFSSKTRWRSPVFYLNGDEGVEILWR